jgi:hypothetical protein
MSFLAKPDTGGWDGSLDVPHVAVVATGLIASFGRLTLLSGIGVLASERVIIVLIGACGLFP